MPPSASRIEHTPSIIQILCQKRTPRQIGQKVLLLSDQEQSAKRPSPVYPGRGQASTDQIVRKNRKKVLIFFLKDIGISFNSF